MVALIFVVEYASRHSSCHETSAQEYLIITFVMTDTENRKKYRKTSGIGVESSDHFD